MRPVCFADAVALEKHEAFAVCEALAVGERALVSCGRSKEAAGLADVFTLLELRLTAGDALPSTARGRR